MKIIESRKLLGPGAVLWLRLTEQPGPFPFRVRVQQRGHSAVIAACETEDLARGALERHTEAAKAKGWQLVPLRLRLALEIPEAGGAAQAAGVPVRVGTNPVAALPASEGAEEISPESAAHLAGFHTTTQYDVPAGIGPVGEQEGTPSAEPSLESDAVQSLAGDSQDAPARPACSPESHARTVAFLRASPIPARPCYCGGCGERLP